LFLVAHKLFRAMPNGSERRLELRLSGAGGRRPFLRGGRTLTATLLLAVLAGCGGGDDNAADDPLALSGKPSDACSQAIVDGHNMEAAGRPAPFLQSIRVCGSLAEWTEAAKGFGIDLKGREAQFVDNTCNASSDDVKALKICQEAKVALSDPRRIP
jgi:hypothetical protein